jgi:hypothetical protein
MPSLVAQDIIMEPLTEKGTPIVRGVRGSIHVSALVELQEETCQIPTVALLSSTVFLGPVLLNCPVSLVDFYNP